MSVEESQFNVQGYNIVTILKRLEAATSRLEDITIFQEEAHKAKQHEKDGGLARDVGGSSGIESSYGVTPTPAPVAKEEKPKFLTSFEDIIKNVVTPFVASSKVLDPLVGEVAENLESAFHSEAEFLLIASKSLKPELTDSSFAEILAPINQKIGKIIEIKDANRRSSFFNHLNTVAEGAPVLGWIVTETPVSFIPDFKDSASFWSNRIMKEFKDTEPKHVEWVKLFLNIFEELKTYVKEYHSTGPSWNKNGKPLADIIAERASATSVPALAIGGGAPPPPPPPPPPASIFEDKKEAPAGSMNAVFADLNKGENITSGLKKVDKSEMTHKNPELRSKDTPVSSKKPAPPKKPTSLSQRKKPAKKELVDGTKWIIEHFTEDDVSEPIVIDVEMHQSVFIGNCSGITVQLKGKANAVSISETKNTGVVVDSLISGIDIIKSYKFGLQITGVVAIVSVDKSDEGSIYLSKESVAADAQVFTSCTTSLNVNVPQDDDFAELAIPEQFKHTIKNGKLVSEVVEHAG